MSREGRCGTCQGLMCLLMRAGEGIGGHFCPEGSFGGDDGDALAVSP